MLSAAEAQRYAEFTRPQRQLQFLIGRSLLRYAIASTASVPMHAISVTERPGNAPLMTMPEKYGNVPYFSLSHSGKFIACLMSAQVPVGLDVEQAQPQRDMQALSQAAFSEDEHSWLLRQHEDLRQTAFYRLWNCKEALYKLMSGQGKQVDTLPLLIDANGIFHESASDWYSVFFACDDLFIATCSSKPLQRLELIDQLTPEHLLAD